MNVETVYEIYHAMYECLRLLDTVFSFHKLVVIFRIICAQYVVSTVALRHVLSPSTLVFPRQSSFHECSILNKVCYGLTNSVRYHITSHHLGVTF
jgi:hypothetical protein